MVLGKQNKPCKVISGQRTVKTKSFRDLVLWQKSHKLTLEIYKLTSSFPSEEKFGLISQMRRASYSIPANVHPIK